MARPRLELQEILAGLDGVQEAAFQADGTKKLNYPCIRYERNDSIAFHADNTLWLVKKRYTVIVIDRDPDSPIPDLVEALPFTKFDRFYIAAGLNHFVFDLYF